MKKEKVEQKSEKQNSESESKAQNDEEQKKHEESGLEEKIQDTETFMDNNQFHEFLKPSTESFSPVLETVEASRQESLERDVAGVLTSTENRDNDLRKYNPVKYIESYTTKAERTTGDNVKKSKTIDRNFAIRQPEKINIETVRRDFNPQLRDVAPVSRDELRTHSIKDSEQTQRKLEIDYVANLERLHRDEKLPFQQTETKYKGKLI